MGALQNVIVVIPCFNEATRFMPAEFARLLSDERISLLFVDDGSTDGTRDALVQFAEAHPRASVLALGQNQGKGEAVRAGLRRALASAPDALGYLDADLATPISEVGRLLERLAHSSAGAVIGARVAHLGADIDRRASRHYLGRIFATAASLILDVAVYDTQCGAKFFRNSEQLATALEDSFCSRWAFDVDLLGRLLQQGVEVIELPLRQWRDADGTKVRPSAMLRAAVDLLQIGYRLRRSKR